MGRTSYTGPVTGCYYTVSAFCPLTGDQFHFLAPCDGHIVEVSAYVETSSSGIYDVDNETSAAAWVNAEALVSDTSEVKAAADIGGSQAVTKGDEIVVTAGGTTCTNLNVLLTFYATGHVAAAEANDT